MWHVGVLLSQPIIDFLCLHWTLTLESHVQLRETEDFAFVKDAEYCLGRSIAALGPARFLTIVPLLLDAKVGSQATEVLALTKF